MMRAGALRGRVYLLPEFRACTLLGSNATTRPDSLALLAVWVLNASAPALRHQAIIPHSAYGPPVLAGLNSGQRQ